MKLLIFFIKIALRLFNPILIIFYLVLLLYLVLGGNNNKKKIIKIINFKFVINKFICC